jgi:ribonuclease T2
MSISAALAAIVVAAVTFSVVVLDRTPSSAAFESDSTNSSLLAVTWSPSLCRAEASAVGCASGHVDELGRTWILHGLWPQPRENQYCDVPKAVADRARNTHGSDMPSVEIDEDVRNSLQPLMSDVAAMTSHEWYAHGTCSGVTPDAYFGDAAALALEVRKVLDPVFAAGIQRISASTVRELFDEEFGSGAGARVGLTCSNVIGEGNVIFEVHLSLPPVVDLRSAGSTLPLGDLLTEGPPIREGCRQARVP